MEDFEEGCLGSLIVILSALSIVGCFGIFGDTWQIICIIFIALIGFIIFYSIAIYTSDCVNKIANEIANNRMFKIKNKFPNAYNEFETLYRINNIKFDNIKFAKTLAKHSQKNWEEKEENAKHAKTIIAKYPNGIKKYKTKLPHFLSSFEIVQNEDKIKQYEEYYKLSCEYNKWEKEQSEFTTKCRTELIPNFLESFGYYKYYIPFEKVNNDGNKTNGEYLVWQAFSHSYCVEEDLNYEGFEHLKRRKDDVPKYVGFDTYKKINNFIEELNKQYNVSVYFCHNNKNWNSKDLMNSLFVMANNLSENINNSFDDYIFDKLLENEDIDHDYYPKLKNRHIVIIEIQTDNEQLKNVCKNIIEKNTDNQPLITYISFFKEFDREEMLKLINYREKAKSIITNETYRRGYEYYRSIDDSYSNFQKILLNKNLFKEKTIELNKVDTIKVSLDNANKYINSVSKIDFVHNLIENAEHLINEINLQEKDDKELKTLLEQTKNQYNDKYKEIGFANDWKEIEVNYDTPSQFIQTENWTYAVVKFPEKGTKLYPYRRRQIARSGHIEKLFFQQLQQWLPKPIKVIYDVCVNISDNSRPYEPDITILVEGHESILIDVEIDEPYTAITNEPIHYIECGDEHRDKIFNNLGWIVVRFAEIQVKHYPESCALYLTKLVKAIVNTIEIPHFLSSSSPLPPINRWTKNEALIMAAQGERQKYLNHTFSKKEEKRIELSDIKLNTNELKCQSFIKPLSISNKKISNTNSRDNDIEFTPYEHIYTYKGKRQLLPVSNLVSYFFEKFDALTQAEKKSDFTGIPAEHFLTEWDKIGKLSRDVGTFLHLQIENYLKKGFFKTEYTFDYYGDKQIVNIETEKKHFFDFINDTSIIPYRQEWPIYDLDLNVAGTIDLICKEGDGGYSIYDWKRSKKIVDSLGEPIITSYGGKLGLHNLNIPDTPFYHYCIQQNLYRYILEKNYGIKIKSMNLVVLSNAYSKYHKIEVPIMVNEIAQVINTSKEQNLGYSLLNY